MDPAAGLRPRCLFSGNHASSRQQSFARHTCWPSGLFRHIELDEAPQCMHGPPSVMVILKVLKDVQIFEAQTPQSACGVQAQPLV